MTEVQDEQELALNGVPGKSAHTGIACPGGEVSRHQTDDGFPRPRRPLKPSTAVAVRQCTGITPTGEQCKARPLSGSDRCAFHATDPATVERFRAARSKGGLATQKKRWPSEIPMPDFNSPEGIRKTLENVAYNVQRGEASPSVAQAVAALVNSSLRLAEVEVTARLKALEKLLNKKNDTEEG